LALDHAPPGAAIVPCGSDAFLLSADVLVRIDAGAADLQTGLHPSLYLRVLRELRVLRVLRVLRIPCEWGSNLAFIASLMCTAGPCHCQKSVPAPTPPLIAAVQKRNWSEEKQ
jgi:hypothetical protein